MNQSEARLHSRRTVHFRPSLSPLPSFRFFRGSVPRLGSGSLELVPRPTCQVTLCRIPVCAEVSSHDFGFDKSRLSVTYYFMVTSLTQSWLFIANMSKVVVVPRLELEANLEDISVARTFYILCMPSDDFGRWSMGTIETTLWALHKSSPRTSLAS